ncbi:hypothetical protein SCHIN_v1c06830 [Spiroplasma chinense]|uniref:Uncharacterized protein n=1 Tax=Spiroplasma chinense TaxID=216932 RepID=A0A5B9Y4J5_9MOLU|nr:hypothetical protein [Spiroplasma chinense]QEH61880.1 hypothetical protein SCHIN_v1c06830 [Spiroplasma chinense]
MNKVQDKNYFLEKLSKDREINALLENESKKNISNFWQNLNEIRNLLHIKEKTDKKIYEEYNRLIVIPTGSEETLIRELHQFNKEMYDWPEFYTLDFPEPEKKEIKKPKSLIKAETRKNILNLSNPYVQDSTFEFEPTVENIKALDKETIQKLSDNQLKESQDIWDKTILDPLRDDDLKFFEAKLKDAPVITTELKRGDWLSELQDDFGVRSEILDVDEKIFVDSEQEKQDQLDEIKHQLEEGQYGRLNLSKPMSITCTKYMKKLEGLKKGFVKSYGSELFKRIRDMIQEENDMYENIDRVRKIEKLKTKKLKLKKSTIKQQRLKEMFKVKK